MQTLPSTALAKDLTRESPRSPRRTLAGYVIIARTLDKCRAVLNGTQGKYEFNTPIDRQFFSFTGIDAVTFKEFVATGATDDAVADWIVKTAKTRPRLEIIKWNNHMREMRPSQMPDDLQEFLEDYIAKHVPRHRPVYCWFDVYDLEEDRI